MPDKQHLYKQTVKSPPYHVKEANYFKDYFDIILASHLAIYIMLTGPGVISLLLAFTLLHPSNLCNKMISHS